eukprot:3940708-Rhodomonas_salina.2
MYGTDIAHAATSKTNGGDRFDVRVRHNTDYAVADILGTGSLLCVCYGMSGTEIAYAATRHGHAAREWRVGSRYLPTRVLRDVRY